MKIENLEEIVASDLLEPSDIYEYIQDCPQINKKLRNYIDDLPELERSIIYMRFWEDKTEYEIAYDSGLMEEEVEYVLEIACNLLKDRLVHEYYHPKKQSVCSA